MQVGWRFDARPRHEMAREVRRAERRNQLQIGASGDLQESCGRPDKAEWRLITELRDRRAARRHGIDLDALLLEKALCLRDLEQDNLSKGEADVAIRGGDPRDGSLVGRKIADVAWGIYATRSYIERYGRPRTPGDLNAHRVIRFDEGLADHKAARWLRSNAPNATVCGESGNIPSILLAVKSGAGIAHLPVPVGDGDPELVSVLGPLKELSYPMYLLAHRDLRRAPRISAFFDFCAKELGPVLRG